jgi:ferric-dicitrate binding protein FerR (iron transport regulator)
MMEPSNRLAYLFFRYYEKKATQQEKDELFELLRHGENDEAVKRLIEETWAQDLPLYKQENTTANKILEYIISRQPPVIHQHSLPNRYLYLRYAAAILVAVLASFFTYHYYFLRPVHHSPAPLANAAAAPPTDQCLTLSDGSKVLLHKGARIHFDSVFTGRTREVELNGEAYFDIRHDARPFIVHTRNITTTVLGTAFNIDEHDKDIVITVTKGKVRVDNGKGDFGILRRNEQITVDQVHNKLKKTKVDAGEVIAWKKPYLLFNDASMKEAVLELEQRFHVTITLTNPALENCNVTATFTGGEPLEQVIKVLSKINNMDYRMIGSHIELNGEGCK